MLKKCQPIEREIVKNCEECKSLSGNYCTQVLEQQEIEAKYQMEQEQRKQQAIAEAEQEDEEKEEPYDEDCDGWDPEYGYG